MFGLKPKVNTNENDVDEALSRGIVEILPLKDDLKKALTSGRRLRIFIGADATGASLHIGHSTSYLALERLRQLGHEIIVLFGDFTAQIGDPTDKSAARVRLSADEVNNNLKNWEKQIAKIVSFNDSKNPATIRRNADWLSKLSFEDVVNLSSNFTVQQMVERDMFEKRINDGKPIYLHEFLYPLMQGYDSVAMDVDVELGGTDQTFNMLAGRVLQKKLNNKEKFVVSVPLLEDPKTGRKMSKSEGWCVFLDDSPEEMFGKMMSLPDEGIISMFRNITNKPLDEVAVIEKDLSGGSLHPKDAKKLLAKEIVKMYHSSEAADAAEKDFENTFAKGEAPADTLEVTVTSGNKLSEVLLANKVIDSKSEWRRLVEQGGVSNIKDNKKVEDPNFEVSTSATYRIGKKRFIKVVV